MENKNNELNATVSTLFTGMDNFLSTKTVVGEPTQIGDTIILPLCDVSFGVAAGAFINGGKNSNNAGGGMGGKMTPSAVLVIKDGQTKLVNIKNQDTVTKILDMVPDLIDKTVDIISGFTNKGEEEIPVEETVEVEVEAE